MPSAAKTLHYLLGTMIETPRAALVADSIAQQAEFFSFGTNDLTQMTMGFSRDDAGRFLPDYIAQGIYACARCGCTAKKDRHLFVLQPQAAPRSTTGAWCGRGIFRPAGFASNLNSNGCA